MTLSAKVTAACLALSLLALLFCRPPKPTPKPKPPVKVYRPKVS